MKRLFQNAVKDLTTSLFGAVAGLPQIFEGVTTKDPVKFLEGLALLLLGMISQTKGEK